MPQSRIQPPNVLARPILSTKRERPTFAKRWQQWRGIASEHLHLLILLCIAAFPLFYDLGDDYLWSDEGDTAVLAQSILQFGVPKAWDGITFTDSDMGTRENKDLVMVSHPWMQYYVTAASFCLLGENTFAARFPFALAAFLTIPLIYALVFRLTTDRKAALAACLLLIVSVQFLLFSRQCRNYALNMFLTCLLLYQFFELKSFRHALLFALTGVFLFHCHPSGIAPLAALAVLALVYKPFKIYRRWLWISLPFIAALTLPWFALARDGYAENTTFLKDWHLLVPRLLQFLIECGSVTPVVGVVVLFAWLWIRQWRKTPQAKRKIRNVSFEVLKNGERDLMVVVLFLFAAYSALIAVTISRTELWNVGLRHTTAIIPLTMAITGLLISKVSRHRTVPFLALLVLFCFTKLGRITPWSFAQDERVAFDPSAIVAMHVPKTWQDRFFRTALPAFSRDLWHHNRGAVAGVCEFLKTNAAPGDVMITNYEWEPVYFHTGLPQGLKILPSYPIYKDVQRHGFPFYVYTVKDARWIVWRTPWNGYRDYDWQGVYTSLIESGASLTRVGTVPETAWENQPNVHFRRFPGSDYKFRFYENLQDVQIYRVDWPWAMQSNLKREAASAPRQTAPRQMATGSTLEPTLPGS